MIKTIEIIAIIALIIISFFLGVKYSNSVKSHMSWLETQDEQEVELPDLSNEPTENVNPNPEGSEINNVPPVNNPVANSAESTQIGNEAQNAPNANAGSQPAVAPVAPAPVNSQPAVAPVEPAKKN